MDGFGQMVGCIERSACEQGTLLEHMGRDWYERHDRYVLFEDRVLG